MLSSAQQFDTYRPIILTATSTASSSSSSSSSPSTSSSTPPLSQHALRTLPTRAIAANHLSNNNNNNHSKNSSSMLRPHVMRLNVVHGASGSSYVTLGATKVLASVFGPRAASKRVSHSGGGASAHETLLFITEAKFAPCSQNRSAAALFAARRAQSDEERVLSAQLTACIVPALSLRLYPKCAIQAYVLILQDDGACFDACLVALSLALAQAQIEMKYLIAAATVSRFCSVAAEDEQQQQNKNNRADSDAEEWNYAVCCDCNEDEQRLPSFQGELSLALIPTTQELCHLTMSGISMHESSMLHLVSVATEACQQRLLLMQQCLREYFTRIQQQRP